MTFFSGGKWTLGTFLLRWWLSFAEVSLNQFEPFVLLLCAITMYWEVLWSCSKVSEIPGRSQAKLVVIYYKEVLRRANAVLDCQDQSLQREFARLPSGHRFRAAVCRTKRLHVSFMKCLIAISTLAAFLYLIPYYTLALLLNSLNVFCLYFLILPHINYGSIALFEHQRSPSVQPIKYIDNSSRSRPLTHIIHYKVTWSCCICSVAFKESVTLTDFGALFSGKMMSRSIFFPRSRILFIKSDFWENF